jgi:hypothetical protein
MPSDRPSKKPTPGPSTTSGTRARFIGIVDAPDEQTAIAKAIEEFKVQANQRGRLVARRRD